MLGTCGSHTSPRFSGKNTSNEKLELKNCNIDYAWCLLNVLFCIPFGHAPFGLWALSHVLLLGGSNMIKLLRPQPDMLEVFYIKIVHPCRAKVSLFSTQQITCSCFESKWLVLVVLHSTIFLPQNVCIILSSFHPKSSIWLIWLTCQGKIVADSSLQF